MPGDAVRAGGNATGLTTTSELRHQLREELELRGIADARVLDAIEETPAICSSPKRCAHAAYEDSALPIGNGQTISQPYIVALMTQELELSGDEKVLEVGTGSGYQTAILARLCRTGRDDRADRRALPVGPADAGRNGNSQRQFFVGDGTLGNSEHGPYDRVIVTASALPFPSRSTTS